MYRSPAAPAGLVICALLGGLQVIASLAGLTMDSAPPLAIVITGGVLGLITRAAVAPAWRGSRGALPLVMASRAAAALLASPALFIDPSDLVRFLVAIAIAVTLVGIWLLAATLRRTPGSGIRIESRVVTLTSEPSHQRARLSTTHRRQASRGPAYALTCTRARVAPPLAPFADPFSASYLASGLQPRAHDRLCLHRSHAGRKRRGHAVVPAGRGNAVTPRDA
jgi:hypothetical protein